MNALRRAPLRWSVRGTVAVLMLAAGCHEEGLPHFGTLRYESDDFEVWASDGLEACGGTFEYVEGWLDGFREHVGEHASPAKHTFYWLSQEDFAADPCSSGIACARPFSNVIYSTVIPAEHEIVHTELDAQPPSLLLEGAAEVFGSIEPPFTTECSALSLTPWQSATRWADEIDLSCAAADVIGPRRDLVWTRRAVEVAQAGSYELTLESTDPTAQVAIFACDVNCFDGEPSTVIPTTSIATGGRATVFLEAGRHWLEVQHSAGSEAPVSLAIER